MNSAIRWFITEGEPLVVLPKAACDVWEGTDLEAECQPGRDWRITDFDRACVVPGRAAVLRLGVSWALVVNARNSVGWLPLSHPEVAVLATTDAIHDDDPERVLNLFRDCEPAGWRFVAREVPLDRDGLLLMHAANQAVETTMQEYDAPGYAGVCDGVPYPLTGGRYRIEAHSVRTCECGSEVGFIRFRQRPPQGTTAFAHRHRSSERRRRWVPQ